AKQKDHRPEKTRKAQQPFARISRTIQSFGHDQRKPVTSSDRRISEHPTIYFHPDQESCGIEWPQLPASEHHFVSGAAFRWRTTTVLASGGTGRCSVAPLGQRTCRAVIGAGLLTTSVAEFCDQYPEPAVTTCARPNPLELTARITAPMHCGFPAPPSSRTRNPARPRPLCNNFVCSLDWLTTRSTRPSPS